MQKLIKMKPIKLGTKKYKGKVYKTASELYNKGFKNCYYEYSELSEIKKDNFDQKLNLYT